MWTSIRVGIYPRSLLDTFFIMGIGSSTVYFGDKEMIGETALER